MADAADALKGEDPLLLTISLIGLTPCESTNSIISIASQPTTPLVAKSPRVKQEAERYQRAVSIDTPSSSSQTKLPVLKPAAPDADGEWGIIYDDEVDVEDSGQSTDRPIRTRAQSLDTYNSSKENGGGVIKPRRSFGQGTDKMTSPNVKTLPSVDEHSSQLGEESPFSKQAAPAQPPIYERGSSFRRRNSQTILSRQNSNEIEVISQRSSEVESPRTSFFSCRESSPNERPSIIGVVQVESLDESDLVVDAKKSDETRPPEGSTPAVHVRSTETAVAAIAVKKPSATHPESKLTNAHVLQFHRHLLSEYEINEILDFRNVYFFGHGANKIEPNVASSSYVLENFGFDDQDGNFITSEGNHIAFRYEVISRLGKGSFGVVHKCMDHRDCRYVAVKVIKNRKRFHKQVASEIKILEMIRSHPDFQSSNCILLQESFQFRKHVCLTFPLQGRSLFDYMEANEFKPNSREFVFTIAYQLLECLSFLFNLDIIHCDLKPENILLCNEVDYKIKLIDFGSSCLVNEKVFQYIQSRYYRAPEVIFGFGYGKLKMSVVSAFIYFLTLVCVPL